ncbi:hypothetical protein [Streptomyces aidingensis]|uniref:Uncharacterized protein n=1 Tax=Streptomyces aidingensis TaxID=910347 RepID=A0A1I1R939_9ACTN|nr:hypothetical protein [Streptomyces aidingensis]SFD26850.1 hypothetical protein SAMN05421773_11269 [Streptomyces aidingensis]
MNDHGDDHPAPPGHAAPCTHGGELSTDQEGNKICAECRALIYPAHAVRAARQSGGTTSRTEQHTPEVPGVPA